MTFDFDTFIAAASGAGVFTFLFKIGEKLVDEYLFDKRGGKLSKSDLTDEILKICSEARTSNFKVAARDSEHIEFIIHKANLYNKEIGKLLDGLASIWILIIKLGSGTKIQGVDNDAYTLLIENYQEEGTTISNELLEKVKNW